MVKWAQHPESADGAWILTSNQLWALAHLEPAHPISLFVQMNPCSQEVDEILLQMEDLQQELYRKDAALLKSLEDKERNRQLKANKQEKVKPLKKETKRFIAEFTACYKKAGTKVKNRIRSHFESLTNESVGGPLVELLDEACLGDFQQQQADGSLEWVVFKHCVTCLLNSLGKSSNSKEITSNSKEINVKLKKASDDVNQCKMLRNCTLFKYVTGKELQEPAGAEGVTAPAAAEPAAAESAATESAARDAEGPADPAAAASVLPNSITAQMVASVLLSWDEDQVSQYLRKSCSGLKEKVIAKLSEEEVDGRIFLPLTKEKLEAHPFCFKYGSCERILHAIGQLSEALAPPAPPPEAIRPAPPEARQPKIAERLSKDQHAELARVWLDNLLRKVVNVLVSMKFAEQFDKQYGPGGNECPCKRQHLFHDFDKQCVINAVKDLSANHIY